jgi:hypothetical protein
MDTTRQVILALSGRAFFALLDDSTRTFISASNAVGLYNVSDSLPALRLTFSHSILSKRQKKPLLGWMYNPGISMVVSMNAVSGQLLDPKREPPTPSRPSQSLKLTRSHIQPGLICELNGRSARDRY